MRQYILITIASLLFSVDLDAQLFKKISNRVQDKLEQRMEDKIVEEVSEEIARRAMRPIDKAFDNFLREAYKEEYGEDYDDSQYAGDPEKRAEALGALLGSMYGDVVIPESYNFDYRLDIAITDYGEKSASHKMMMFIAPGSGYFGMSQSDNSESFMIMDVKNDQVVIFNDKDKSVMGIKGVMMMARSFASASKEHMETYMTVEKNGQSKKVAGYASDGYSYSTDEDDGEFYLTTALPFDWEAAFASIYEQMFSDFYENKADFSGMLMYSEAKRKKDGKKSKWEVTTVSNKEESVDTTKYKKVNPMSGSAR